MHGLRCKEKMERISVEGAIDIHVHASPDIVERIGNDRDIVRSARDAGMLGVQLKGHAESTVSRAWLINQEFSGIHVFGGIVLNRYVGGINPYAVESCLQNGGKTIWMPTLDANYHAQKYGRTGRFSVQELNDKGDSSGIKVVDENGKLLDAVMDVLELVSDYNAVLATSHLSPDEIIKLVDAAREKKVEKICLTHPFVLVPGVDLEFLKMIIPKGVFAEFGYDTVSPMVADSTLDQIKEAIEALGPENCILMSDGGQIHNPWPSECLRVFGQCLHEKGIPRKDVERMMAHNPRQLMNI